MKHQAPNARDIYGQRIRENVKLSADARAAKQAVKDQKQEQREAERMAGWFTGRGLSPTVGYQTYYTAIDGPAPPPQPKLNTEAISLLAGVEARRIQKPAEPVPDRIECIVGWRGWEVKNSGGQLRLEGLGTSHLWDPRKPLEAECKRSTDIYMSLAFGWGSDPAKPPEQHPAPGKECTCGIWAFRTLEEFQKMAEQYHKTVVVGQVYLWGRVLECENGFRAQYAYPKELWLMNKEHESLGWIYNVPVRTL